MAKHKATQKKVSLLGGCSRSRAGALAGSAVGVPGMGAAIGGVGGALAGYSIGHHLQNAQNEQGYGVGLLVSFAVD